MPLRKFIELALEKALNFNANETLNQEVDSSDTENKSIWQDEYLKIQLQQPIGSPIELTEEEHTAFVESVLSQHEEARSQFGNTMFKMVGD